jgi:hypothetical protein
MLWAFGVSKLLMAPRHTHKLTYYTDVVCLSHSLLTAREEWLWERAMEMKFTGSQQHHTAEE